MVQYWKQAEMAQARITKGVHGEPIMYIEGEKYPFPTFPRGHLLFGSLSKLKHEIKNQVFNESWRKLENGVPNERVIKEAKTVLLGEIAEIAKNARYDMLPPDKMTRSTKEIYRAWTKVAPKSTYILRDYLCYILNEDDGYRFRAQWLVNYFNPSSIASKVLGSKYLLRTFAKSLEMIEHAEVIGDMKERIRLLRRVLLMALEDRVIRELFIALVKEIDWNEVKLTKADKYYFRGKYFKVDYPIIDY